MDNRYFSDKVVKWYLQNSRDLPWRRTRDPYKVWLSEIILQQTRVKQGMPYYLKFIERYPTVHALAGASEQEVLRLWQGLGYYTRARNLHKCAKQVDQKYRGNFPKSFEELKQLPGIGEYTAAAIASFCFGERVAVVDGNVFRVLSRVFGIDKPINAPEGKKEFTSLANTLIPEANPAEYNQAIMEFGALQCVPKNPSCDVCPLRTTCFAAQHSLQENLPVKIKAKAARKRYFNYFVIRNGNSILMNKREEKDIWRGLYDFYLVETKRSVRAGTLLEKDDQLSKMKLKKNPSAVTKKYKHVLSHQIIIGTFTVIDSASRARSHARLKYFTETEIANLPKPVLITRFMEDHQLL